jgi:hypothetical protein
MAIIELFIITSTLTESKLNALKIFITLQIVLAFELKTNLNQAPEWYYISAISHISGTNKQAALCSATQGRQKARTTFLRSGYR